MRIGILGGSFNPPHKMHLNMGLELLNKNYVDKIIYVPTGSKYKYKNNLVADHHRFKMLEMMIKDNDKLDVSDYELKDEVIYTCDTLKYFQEIYPNDEIYFVCGADNLSYVDEWKNGIYLLENYKFLVIKRYTDDIEEILKRFSKYKDNIIVSDVEPDSLSSTEIRNKIKSGEGVFELLDKEVYEYILDNKLYE
ncbi:MAG: nicotinate (nicotinamide) nucleotide adenylyltransferase [Bacilli bacterium]|nr:nicotinate (nicotinamide) nucleotide adenylyltransferase [Bacilli bacterium]